MPTPLAEPEVAAVAFALRRLPDLARSLGELDAAVLPLPGDPEGVRVVAVSSLEDWLEGLAIRVEAESALP